jgi:hypothetical protein
LRRRKVFCCIEGEEKIKFSSWNNFDIYYWQILRQGGNEKYGNENCCRAEEKVLLDEKVQT